MHTLKALTGRCMLAVAVICAATLLPRAADAETRGATLHEYQDKHGVPVLTNRPARYRNDPDLVEIKVKYSPISVPKQYRNRKSPVDYTPGSIRDLVQRYAKVYGVEEELILAVIKAESNFNPKAVSHCGACGLMQLMPGTAAEMGVTKIFDPAQNIAGGTQYLMKMQELFKGNRRLALAAYNAGPAAVTKYGGVPPYKETQSYVVDVDKHYRTLKQWGVTDTFTTLARGSRYRTARAPGASRSGKRYVIHFHSGLTQPADMVTDKEPYYYIHFGKRTYPVRKDLVKHIEEPA